MSNFVLRASGLFSLLCLCWSAQAADNLWTEDGPEGGAATWVDQSPLNPAFRFAGSLVYSYRWDDEAERWERASVGVAGDRLIFSSVDPLTAFQFANGLGFAKTTDGGLTYQPASNGLPSGSLRGMTMDANGRLYMSTSNDGVFTSDDAGDSWQSSTNGWPFFPDSTQYAWVRTFDTAPGRPQRVYATLGGNGFVMSDDAGASWTVPSANGFPSRAFFAPILVDPLDEDHVWLGGDIPYETFDAGETWSQVPGLPVVGRFSAAPDAPATVYAMSQTEGKVYRTDDSGQTWIEDSQFLLPQGNGNSDVVDGNIVIGVGGRGLLATNEGVFERASSAEPWTLSNAGFVANDDSNLAQNATTGRLYLGGNGMRTSTDNGVSWERIGGGFIDRNGLDHDIVRYVAVSQLDDQVVYSGFNNSNIVYRSSDGGQSWQQGGEIPSFFGVRTLAAAPSSANRLYASPALSGLVWRSDDRGESWTLMTQPGASNTIRSIAVSPVDADIVMVDSFGDSLIHFSDDGGESWSEVISGETGSSVENIQFSSRDPQRVYASVNDAAGLTPFVSDDSGRTWTQQSFAGHSTVWSVADHPVEAGVLHIASGIGVHRSLDNGQTFERLADFQTDATYSASRALYVDRLTPYELYGFENASGMARYSIARDLLVDITTETAQVTLNDMALYTVVIANGAEGIAGRVRLTLPAPDNGLITSATTSVGSCNVADGSAQCELDALDAADTWQVALAVKPVFLGPVMVSGSATSIEKELTEADNAAVDASVTVISADVDGDTVEDALDNCVFVANADQRDTDADGYGNLCDADLNNDGVINIVDLGLLRSVFFSADADADFNGDGVVNVLDLGVLRSMFFGTPGPSGTVGTP